MSIQEKLDELIREVTDSGFDPDFYQTLHKD